MLGSKTRVEVNEIKTTEIFIFDGRPLIAKSNGELFPTLTFKEIFPLIPKIVVDMGAVPYVCKGADVMAPGIVDIKGEFEENDLLLIIDERQSKSIFRRPCTPSATGPYVTKRTPVEVLIVSIIETLWSPTIRRPFSPACPPPAGRMTSLLIWI